MTLPNAAHLQHELSLANPESPLAISLAFEIDRAPMVHLGEMIRRVWAAVAAGKLDVDTAGELDQRARDRQRSKPVKRPAVRRPPRSPDRMRSAERRRGVSSQGWMPPAIAARFTEGERAALSIIAQEVKRCGACNMFNDQIAALAGVSASTVKNAKRRARVLDLVEIEEWKQAADWNGPSRVKIVSPEWRTWLAHHREPKMTDKPLSTTRNQKDNRSRFAAGLSVSGRQNGERSSWGNARRGYPGIGSASGVPRTE